MCKEMPVIPVSKVVDLKRNNKKKWRAKEEKRHKGLLTKKNKNKFHLSSRVLAKDKIRGFTFSRLPHVCMYVCTYF
jgi:hypothetical protein